ncbi:MAG: hypothetical protein RI544_07425, partial [Haloquadratum sp.]|nr:hypothetical protein [Haloquadratum sp.]
MTNMTTIVPPSSTSGSPTNSAVSISWKEIPGALTLAALLALSHQLLRWGLRRPRGRHPLQLRVPT